MHNHSRIRNRSVVSRLGGSRLGGGRLVGSRLGGSKLGAKRLGWRMGRRLGVLNKVNISQKNENVRLLKVASFFMASAQSKFHGGPFCWLTGLGTNICHFLHDFRAH